ncbi:cysteine hydrolase family protein [uncultured Fibrobacter sp.]|uniref:cysteine hydrolase family protein n=1 Tax=uncultured Fibrobacter sp. TaxID=261512 RepID=UPI00262BBBA7|nr:cysteine hydrolase family protein [uncultured Fibrobacter sp.]
MVLLIVDTQKLIMNERLYRFEELAANIRTLIHTARQNGIEVIYIRHDDGEDKPLTKGKDGFEICEAFAPDEGEMIFDKTVNSPFRDTGLLEYLKSKDETELIVAGLQTDYCMDATVKCGFEHGFKVYVPAYTNSTFDNAFMTAEETYRYYNVFMWNGRYAECISMKVMLQKMEK